MQMKRVNSHYFWSVERESRAVKGAAWSGTLRKERTLSHQSFIAFPRRKCVQLGFTEPMTLLILIMIKTNLTNFRFSTWKLQELKSTRPGHWPLMEIFLTNCFDLNEFDGGKSKLTESSIVEHFLHYLSGPLSNLLPNCNQKSGKILVKNND